MVSGFQRLETGTTNPHEITRKKKEHERRGASKCCRDFCSVRRLEIAEFRDNKKRELTSHIRIRKRVFTIRIIRSIDTCKILFNYYRQRFPAADCLFGLETDVTIPSPVARPGLGDQDLYFVIRESGVDRFSLVGHPQ